MAEIRVKNEEAKTITFTITRDNAVLDVSAATAIDFVVKESYDDTSYLIEKNISDFDTSQASVGIVSCTLETADLAAGDAVTDIIRYLSHSDDRNTIISSDGKSDIRGPRDISRVLGKVSREVLSRPGRTYFTPGGISSTWWVFGQ